MVCNDPAWLATWRCLHAPTSTPARFLLALIVLESLFITGPCTRLFPEVSDVERR